MFIWCCPIKCKQHDFPCIISFKQAVLHCFRKNKHPDQTSSAGIALLYLQAAPVPGNMLQGAGRQHDRCSPTTQYVTGLDTSAGKAVLFLSLWYTVRHWWLTLQMFTGQHWYLFGFCCCRYIMPEFAGYYKPLFYTQSIHLTEGPFFQGSIGRLHVFIHTFCNCGVFLTANRIYIRTFRSGMASQKFNETEFGRTDLNT